MAQQTFTKREEGIRVGADSEKIGLISGIGEDTASVDPDPSITGTVMPKLGWMDIDDGDYSLPLADIDQKTDDEVVTRDPLT